MYNILVVIITKTTAQLLVIHFRLVLADAPATCYLVWVSQLKLPSIAGPRDKALA